MWPWRRKRHTCPCCALLGADMDKEFERLRSKMADMNKRLKDLEEQSVSKERLSEWSIRITELEDTNQMMGALLTGRSADLT